MKHNLAFANTRPVAWPQSAPRLDYPRCGLSRSWMSVWRRVLLGAGVSVVGCAAPRDPPVVGHPSPEINIAAMRRAARDRDLSAAKSLVHELESDDPAVRFYAINALQRLTGLRMGYEFFAPQEERAAAVGRWREWLEQHSDGPALRNRR